MLMILVILVKLVKTMNIIFLLKDFLVKNFESQISL